MGRPVVELLLDSTILIDRFNKIPEAKKYLADTRGKAAISVVTRAEVLTGFDASLRAVAISS
jgi:predicted nucleic acid-binding protein